MTLCEVNCKAPRMDIKDVFLRARAEEIVDKSKCIITKDTIAVYDEDYPAKSLYVVDDKDESEVVVLCDDKTFHIPYTLAWDTGKKSDMIMRYPANAIDTMLLSRAVYIVKFAEEMKCWSVLGK